MKRKHQTHKAVLMKQFSTDDLMTKVARSLIRDFQTSLDEPLFAEELERSFVQFNIEHVRRECAAIEPDASCDVSHYKARYQLQSLLKRHRYQTDIYSDEELLIKAVKSFEDTQHRIRSVDLDTVSSKTKSVLNLARVYVADLLGAYSDDEHRSLSRFGKRASVGVSARKACLAARWELPISGSQMQIAWFDSEMSQDSAVQDYWHAQLGSDPNRSTYQVTSDLKLVLVPKTFKSLRAIMPNTTIGSYMSFGLGEMMRIRLKRKGFNIRTLQQRHRMLAQVASTHGKWTTADLSSASDSISVALVRYLFPPDWVEILEQSRIGNVVLPDGRIVESETFSTMGVGYTFPLQTLVFLALLKAISLFHFGKKARDLISVYGDDMIYHSRLHEHVVEHFAELGFVINLDKTFHEGHFRESCGGDYYRGVDVRPFQPQNGPAMVGPKAYEATLYKYINGLLTRWSECEIRRTLKLLTSELEDVTGKCKIVPGTYPDTSGIQCPTLGCHDFLATAEVVSPKHLGSGVYRFPYLRYVSEVVKEERHEPYLWDRLRGSTTSTDLYDSRQCLQEPPGLLVSFINKEVGIQEVTSELVVREVMPVQYTRSKLSGERLRRLETVRAVSTSGSYKRQLGTSCFEDRRRLA